MKKIQLALILTVFISTLTSYSYAQDREVNILVLMTYHQSFPWAESFLAGLNNARSQYGKRINFYVETMDTLNFKSSLSDPEWTQYLSKKYKYITFDAAIAESTRASIFLYKYNSLLAPGTPKIFYTGTGVTGNFHNLVFSTQYDESVKKTIDIAFEQNADAEDIYVIHGDEESNIRVTEIINMQFKTKGSFSVHIIKNFTLKELSASVSQIPENSIVFFTIIRKDRMGKTVISKQLLTDISKISKAPIYSFWSSLMGSGIVGGHMIDGASTAESMVEAAMDYIEKGKFKDKYSTLKTYMDWNALERFGIDKDATPDFDTVILNKPLTILDQYLMEVIVSAAVVAFLLFVIFLYWSRKLAGLNRKLKEQNIDMKIAKERAEDLARVDTLTGLSNRLVFFETGQQICKEVKRLEKHVSLLMLDIDHFKAINDTYGHLQGDIVLKKTAEIINKCKRESDVSIRFGGEEFIVVAPFTDMDGAKNLAERIRAEAENSVIEFEDKQIRFTLSIGVFTINPSNCDLNFGIKCADNALYKAKANGRNQVALWEAD